MTHGAGVNGTDLKPREYMWREMVLTIEWPTITNAREPNMTRIILLRLNTAYVLKPHTAVS